MLKRLVMENFLSFKERTEIDFMKTNYTILPSNVSDDKVLKGAIFVGANASGKTNVLRALEFIIDLFFGDSKDNNIYRYNCIFNDLLNYQLEYVFLIDNSEVHYSIKVDYIPHCITEKLSVDNELFFERNGNNAVSYISDKKGIEYSEEIAEDSSFLRTVYFNTKFAGNAILVKWMNFLKNSISYNLYTKDILSNRKDEFDIIKYLDKEGTGKLNEFFAHYNFEQEVKYDNRVNGEHIDYYLINKQIFFRRKSIDDPIPFNQESLGNKTLLKILPIFLSAIENNSMLIVDEFSSGFHNDLEELLVRHFMKYAKNSQLFLVSHSTNLLSNSIFRPDQEYSVYFNGANGSKLKRFSDEQPRNAQNVEKMYNSGVFGGLPNYEVVDNEDK